MDNKRFTAKAIIGMFPTNSVEMTLKFMKMKRDLKVLTKFHTLRQQMTKPEGQFNHALADYIAPKDSGRIDYIGGILLLPPPVMEQMNSKRLFEDKHDDYNSIIKSVSR